MFFTLVWLQEGLQLRQPEHGAEQHLPWLSFIKSADFSSLSAVPVQRVFIMLPDEKSSAPGELTQCLFFQSHWLMELHNFHSARRRPGKQPAHVPVCTISPGSHLSLEGKPPGTTWETPRTEEYVHKGERKYVNDSREIMIICMFIRGKSINMHVKYSI